MMSDSVKVRAVMNNKERAQKIGQMEYADCKSCGARKSIEDRPYEDLAVCLKCGYKYLGLPRNPSLARSWSVDEYENAELYRKKLLERLEQDD